MQRVKILGGRLSGAQWRTLAEQARTVTPGTPLHLTTRQDIEFHNVSASDVGRLQQALAAADISAVGACGDTPRNVTIDPQSGALDAAVDLGPLAWQIRTMLEQTAGVYALPRKFKISLSSSASADAQPWINDLGLIAADGNDPCTFDVIVAGSLGALPQTGVVYRKGLAAADVLPLVAAAVDLFAEHGDRDNRRKARLRHVRQRLGDEAFAQTLTERFERFRCAAEYPQVRTPRAETGLMFQRTLTFANGDVTPDAADALALLADRDDSAVRLGNQHRVHVFGGDDQALSAAVACDALAAAAAPQPAIVACPGTRWCKLALVDTNAMADAIRRAVGDRVDPETCICISGCPNGCAHTAVADVGLSGARVTGPDGDKQQRFNAFVDGDMGRGPALAKAAGTKLQAVDVIDLIRRRAGLE